jgi:hypothetical protein
LDPATYYVDTTSEPARIVPTPSLTWPSTQLYLPGSVQVTYIAGSYGAGTGFGDSGFGDSGFGDPSTVPFAVQAAILLMLGHLYEHRETVSDLSYKEIPLGAKALLDTVRFETFTFASGY